MRAVLNRRLHWAFLCTVALAIHLAPLAKADIQYNITDLGTLGGISSFANGISSNGLVTGYFTTSGGINEAFVTDSSGTAHTISGLNGANSIGYGVNAAGEVAGGYLASESDRNFHAFIANADGSIRDLDPITGSSGTAYGINDKGQATGGLGGDVFFTDLSGVIHTFRNPNSIDDFGFSINEAGQITGTSISGQIAFYEPLSNAQHVFIADATGSVTYYDSSTFAIGVGCAINSSGAVAGYGYKITSGNNPEAFIIGPDGVIQDLGSGARAYGINDEGDVVGANLLTGAFVDINGTIVNLNNALDPTGASEGWVLDEATAINDAGQVVGDGGINGQEHAFLLTPTPEPRASVIALIAMFGFHLLGRRRPHAST